MRFRIMTLAESEYRFLHFSNSFKRIRDVTVIPSGKEYGTRTVVRETSSISPHLWNNFGRKFSLLSVACRIGMKIRDQNRTCHNYSDWKRVWYNGSSMRNSSISPYLWTNFGSFWKQVFISVNFNFLT